MNYEVLGGQGLTLGDLRDTVQVADNNKFI